MQSVVARCLVACGLILSTFLGVQQVAFPHVSGQVSPVRALGASPEASAPTPTPTPAPATPLSLGNPSWTLGYPTDTISTYVPYSDTVEQLPQNMTLAINGPDQWTESGDPYAPLYELSDPPVTNVSGAQLIANPFRSQASPAFDGYDYQVTIPYTTGAAYIQIYDAETCVGNSGTGSTGFADSVQLADYGVPYTNLSQQYPSPSGAPHMLDGAPYGPYPTYYSLYYIDPTTGQRPVFRQLICLLCRLQAVQTGRQGRERTW